MTRTHRKLGLRFGAVLSLLGLSSACSLDVADESVASADELALTRGDTAPLGDASLATTPAPSGPSTQINVGVIPTATLGPTLSTSPTTSATRYFVLDIGSVGSNTKVIHISQTGSVAWSNDSSAFLFKNCTSRNLGSLAGGTTQANALNKNDVVVGKSFKNGKFHAFSWSNGVIKDLGGSLNEEATAINFWGDIAGIESVDGTLAATGVKYVDGVVGAMAKFLVNPPSGFANAPRVAAMNDSRVVVGAVGSTSSNIAAISFNFGAQWQRLQGVPGLEFNTEPAAVNYLGHVTGVAGQGLPRAFISRDPTQPATDLGTLPGGAFSVGSGINSYDRVVGLADKNGGGPFAMLHDGTTMVDLNTRLWNPSGWVLKLAADINDKGQIVGFGSFNGGMHAFLLLPMTQAPLVPPCQSSVSSSG